MGKKDFQKNFHFIHYGSGVKFILFAEIIDLLIVTHNSSYSLNGVRKEPQMNEKNKVISNVVYVVVVPQ